MELKLWPWENDIKPFFINEEGVEWYVDESCTKWAHREDSKGISLPNIFVFILREKDGNPLTRVVMNKTNNAILKESTNMEVICAFIDMLKANEHFK